MRSASLLFALGLALCAALFFALFERAPARVETGLQGPAARDPYLALEHLVRGMGGRVQRSASLDALDPLPAPGLAILIPGQRLGMTPERAERLLAWVRRGGHLIAVPWSFWDDPDRSPDWLLDPLGVRQYPRGSLDSRGGESPENQDEDEGEPGPPSELGIARWAREERSDPLELAFQPAYVLELEPEREAALARRPATGNHWISVPAGAGYTTVLTDTLWLENGAIGRRDHAVAAIELIRLFGGSGDLAIAGGDRVAEIGPAFFRRLWPLALALGILVLLYLVARLPRVGPIVPDRDPSRRDLMEHVLACGRLRLRASGAASLLEPVRTALLRRIERRHSHWLQRSEAELAEQLAEGTALRAEQIERGLRERPSTPREAVEFIRILESVRRRL